jgi:hypothetical protein
MSKVVRLLVLGLALSASVVSLPKPAHALPSSCCRQALKDASAFCDQYGGLDFSSFYCQDTSGSSCYVSYSCN